MYDIIIIEKGKRKPFQNNHRAAQPQKESTKMAKMTASEMNNCVKATAVEKALNLDTATQIDDFTWAVPVETEDGTRYAKITVTAALAKATKVNPAFDLETAVQAFEDKKREREIKAAEAAAKKAAKASKA